MPSFCLGVCDYHCSLTWWFATACKFIPCSLWYARQPNQTQINVKDEDRPQTFQDIGRELLGAKVSVSTRQHPSARIWTHLSTTFLTTITTRHHHTHARAYTERERKRERARAKEENVCTDTPPPPPPHTRTQRDRER